jgi:16S rRNA (cytidine1402-2'-O)-methyltransferase
LTKKFEQIIRDNLSVINEKIESGEIKVKGEFVVVVEGTKETSITDQEALRINHILSEKLSPKDAAGLAAKITGRKKNEIYQLALKKDL